MTANTTTTRELDISTVTLRAAQLAGILDPQQPTSGAEWTAFSAMARDFLEMDVDALQALGAYAREVDFYELSVTDGTASYSLPAATLNVVGDAMFKPTGSTTETPVQAIAREHYHGYTDKTSEGTPTQYYVHRLETITLYLYPVPDQDGTLTLQRHRLLGDNDDASKTLDLDRYWTLYVTWALAHKLAFASNLPPARCSMLESQAEKHKKLALGYAAQQVDNQAIIVHDTPWSSR